MEPEGRILPPLSAQVLRFIDAYCACCDVSRAALEAGFRAHEGAEVYGRERVRAEIARRIRTISHEANRLAAAQSTIPPKKKPVPQPLDEVLPAICEILASGVTKYRQIAKALNERGIPSARAAAWTSNQVYNVLTRARKLGRWTPRAQIIAPRPRPLE
jgi:hypothetical protein